MDKQEIMYELQKRDFTRKLNQELITGLVGPNRDEYLCVSEPKGKLMTPYLYAGIQSLVAFLVHNYEQKIVDEIIEIINKTK